MNRTLIVILTWNRLKKTRHTLNTLYKHNGKELDFLFVDNGSEDGTVGFLEEHGYRIIKNKTNEGIFRASTKAWMEGMNMGYDFVLNLQNDFPCTKRIPFSALENYMDNNRGVCYIK
ncbi:MAG: glycosyltransferase family 2 protein [Candidatus Asgardarchaeia archaeon]